LKDSINIITVEKTGYGKIEKKTFKEFGEIYGSN